MNHLILFRSLNINQRNLKMEELKAFFFSLGFNKVETIIQSGNVIVESNRDSQELELFIEEQFKLNFNFESKVFVRNLSEMENLLKDYPFNDEQVIPYTSKDPEVEHQYIVFLKEPCPKHLEDSLSTDNDCVIIHDKEIYLLTSLSIRFSKVIKKISKTFELVTIRNLNTTQKCLERMRAFNHD